MLIVSYLVYAERTQLYCVEAVYKLREIIVAHIFLVFDILFVS